MKHLWPHVAGLSLICIFLVAGCQGTGGRQSTPTLTDGRGMARQELIANCSNADQYVRDNALEALSETLPDEAAPIALKALRDPSSAVRYTAALAVGNMRLKEALPSLRNMLDDPKMTVEIGVIYAMHRLGDTSHSHELEGFARKFSPPVAMGENSQTVGIQVRSCTAQVLGLLADPSAIPILLRMLDDPAAAVRLQAAEALWRMNNRDGLKALVAFSISAYPDDQVIAIIALAEPHNQVVSKNIQGLLQADYPEVSLAAARALGMLGRYDGWNIALDGARSKSVRVRSMSAFAMGAMGYPTLLPPLLYLLKDENVNVRIAAATAILQLHAPPVVAPEDDASAGVKAWRARDMRDTEM